MKQQNESIKRLEVRKDYVNKDGLIVIDRSGDTTNRGFDGNNFEHDLFCSSPHVWREATKEEVIEAFEKHLNHRFGEDWRTMKIKESHPTSSVKINDGSWSVEISKYPTGWNVWNRNGLLYREGIWVERLEEENKIHIKEAIKEKTAIHCETEEEAERILNMAHELGHKWCTGDDYENNTIWRYYEGETCYSIFDGTFGYVDFYENSKQIIPSTRISDFEEKKTTDWTPAPEDIETMNKKAIEKLPIDKVTTKNLDIALRSKSLAPHRCPVCNGNGLVPNGFYMQASGHWSTSSITPEACRSCGGTGIVWG